MEAALIALNSRRPRMIIGDVAQILVQMPKYCWKTDLARTVNHIPDHRTKIKNAAQIGVTRGRFFYRMEHALIAHLTPG